MIEILAVGSGGFAGAIARNFLTGIMHRRYPRFLPAGTLLVNVLGCLIIGVLMAAVIERRLSSDVARRALMTGFLGSLTTFSAFGYETIELLRQSELRIAGWNNAANVALGLAAVWVGLRIGKAVFAAA